jgi:hypothetical protein
MKKSWNGPCWIKGMRSTEEVSAIHRFVQCGGDTISLSRMAPNQVPFGLHGWRSPALSGADFTLQWLQGSNFHQVVGNITDFTSSITSVTNPPPKVSSTTYTKSGGGGGGHSCACACACWCACACGGKSLLQQCIM